MDHAGKYIHSPGPKEFYSFRHHTRDATHLLRDTKIFEFWITELNNAQLKIWGFVHTIHQSLMKEPLLRGYFGSWNES